MKKWMQMALVTGGIMIAIGLGLTAVGAAVGVKSIGNYDEFSEWGNDMSEFMNNSKITKVSTGSSKKETKSYTLEPFSKLEIDVDIGTLEIIESGNKWGLEVVDIDAKKFIYVNENGKLEIDYEQDKKYGNNFLNWRENNKYDDQKILLTVPKGTNLSEMSIEVGLAYIAASGLTIKEVDISTGVGETVLENCTIENLTINGGVGEITGNGMKVSRSMTLNSGVGEIGLDGEFKGEIEVDGGVGSIMLNMNNCTEDDYNYTVDQGLGTVKIGEQLKEGFAGSWNKNTATADNYIDVDGGLGEIIINFNR